MHNRCKYELRKKRETLTRIFWVLMLGFIKFGLLRRKVCLNLAPVVAGAGNLMECFMATNAFGITTVGRRGSCERSSSQCGYFSPRWNHEIFSCTFDKPLRSILYLRELRSQNYQIMCLFLISSERASGIIASNLINQIIKIRNISSVNVQMLTTVAATFWTSFLSAQQPG